MNFKNRLIGFVTIFTVIAMAYYIIYGMMTRHVRVPEYQAKIYVLEQKLILCESKVETMKLRVRWNNFLAIMLDKDQQVKFDNLEEYLETNGTIGGCK